ncbi:hypothetical protein EJ08DRAFT_734754 [Tothia fuscella]|uniref:Zn(2)-C6 fungal-type domain-containing protein n=1 Tax=Tothia fuscella TaxID=1048955 RepID=A0A9P4TY10_9PEZI|nr:hypothetical protein EJ08DRAFT_734754 [Tothia fuscella]
MDSQSNSASPPANGVARGPKVHKRIYQACGACRDRKVRCDMGPVDAPNPPPCFRCQRENKKCTFAIARRKNKRALEDDDSSGYDNMQPNKRGRSSSTVERTFETSPMTGSNAYNSNIAPNIAPRPRTPGGGPANLMPLQRPDLAAPPPVDQKTAERSMNQFKSAEMFGGHDGIGTLIDAAGHIDSRHNRHSRGNSFTTPNFRSGNGIFGPSGSQQRDVKPVGLGSPVLSRDGLAVTYEPDAKTIKAWKGLRFVRAGLFTAYEGMAYIKYFFENLYPLTPIRLTDFSHPSTHRTLLRKEPMLLTTILTITSRYMKLDGPGGEYSRPYAIHDKLWNALRRDVERLIWAQEQFGGGLCGGGAQSAKRLDPSTGLRTLGSVEALMLLTEWHPRALHFPPGDDDAELLVPDDSDDDVSDDEVMVSQINAGGKRRDGWLEPCWRSDKMCWMLLSHALSLAFEIGVFDQMKESEFRELNPRIPEAKVTAYFVRKTHLKELLWIYYVQTSGRLELISSLPPNFLESLHQTAADSKMQDLVTRRFDDMQSNRNQPPSPVQFALDHKADTHELTLKFWESIAAILKSGNQQLFLSRISTREVTASGKYQLYLDVYKPILKDWRLDFDKCTAIPAPMRYILDIEFQYSRVYLHSLALHAVVTRCVSDSLSKKNLQHHHGLPILPGRSNSEDSSSGKSFGGALEPEVVQKWMVGKDLESVMEVVDGCHKVLEVVLDKLLPGDYLKHCPVRTYFRIISVTSILLKIYENNPFQQTFVLGNYANTMAKSLNLITQTALALRECSVDDVHVGTRFADDIEKISAALQYHMKRIPAHQIGTTAAASRAQSHSPYVPGSPYMGPPRNGASTTSHPLQQQQWPQNQHGNMQMPPNMHNNMHQSNMQQQPHLPPNGVGTFVPSMANQQFAADNIPGQIYDPMTNEHSIMPPPGGFYTGPDGQFSNGNNGGFAGMNGNLNDGNNFGGEDWLTVPLDALIMNAGGDVNSTVFGPDINGFDMLDMYRGYGPN